MSILTYKVKILEKEKLTHDVMRFVLERPANYVFTAGQAIELTIDHPDFRTDAAPFTLTGLNTLKTLEIIFKVYAEHNGMTLAMSKLIAGDALLIGDAWDSFKYSQPGIFIAGGAGITPFVAILRDLSSTNLININKLIFANKTTKDIFLYDELSGLLGQNFINILSKEKNGRHYHGRIDKNFLKPHVTHFDKAFYLCGPGRFSPEIKSTLLELGAKEELIFSEY